MSNELLKPKAAGTFPQELRDHDQWICWKAVWSDKKGKWDKIPIHPTKGYNVSAPDPKNHLSFDQAYAHFQRGTAGKVNIAGIGFVPTDGDDIICIDLDRTIHVNGDGQRKIVDMEAWRLFKRAHEEGLFCERSVGGEGFHVWCRGDSRSMSHKGDTAVEIFNDGRFIAMVGGQGAIAEAQWLIDASAELIALRKDEAASQARRKSDDSRVDVTFEEGEAPLEVARAAVESVAADVSDVTTGVADNNRWDTHSPEQKDTLLMSAFKSLPDTIWFNLEHGGGYEGWDVCAAVAVRHGGPQAKAVLEVFSSQSHKPENQDKTGFDAADFAYRVRRFSEEPKHEAYTPGSLVRLAKEHGWKWPVFREDAETILDKLKALDDTELKKQWLKLLCDANADEITTHEVIKWLAEDRKLAGVRALNAALKAFKYAKEQEALLQAAKRRVTAHIGQKVGIEFDPMDFDAAVRETAAALLQVPGDWATLLQDTILGYVALDIPHDTHAIDNPKAPAPKVPLFRAYDFYRMLRRTEQSAAFVLSAGEDELGVEIPPKPIPVPANVVKGVLADELLPFPKIRGIITHPYILSDGTPVCEPGFNLHSRLWLDLGGVDWGDDVEFQLNTPLAMDGVSGSSRARAKGAKKAARREFRRLYQLLFAEFQFASSLDVSLALAFLLTAVIRKVLSMAPLWHIGSPMQGSGKTTLARIVHLVLTGHDMPASTLDSDPSEVRKSVLAMLLESPEMICWDNVSDGEKISDPTLAKMSTSTALKDRILGISRNATVGTNVLGVLTGNNNSFDADLARRIMAIKLNPKEARPETINYKVRDVVQHVRGVRQEVIVSVLRIIKAWISAGRPKPSVLADGGMSWGKGAVGKPLPGSGYPEWDEMVRGPLLWVGFRDPARAIERNREGGDPEKMAELVAAMHKVFGVGKGIRATDICEAVSSNPLAGSQHPNWKDLVEPLSELIHKKDPDLGEPRVVGRVLKRLVGRNLGPYKVVHRTESGDRTGPKRYFVEEPAEK